MSARDICLWSFAQFVLPGPLPEACLPILLGVCHALVVPYAGHKVSTSAFGGH